MIIETLNTVGDLWARYLGPALVQNTLFLCLIFIALSLLRNADAKIKYTLTLIGLFKLTLPLVFPLNLSALFPSLQQQPVAMTVGEIEVLSTSLSISVWILCNYNLKWLFQSSHLS